MSEPTKTVRAAGCVVWRLADDGRSPEVLIVHRPRYDDWSFPKGKRDDGESDETCAVREVEEETGMTGELGPELPAIEYTDQKGRWKTVRYWLLRRQAGSFEPNDEVDDVRWIGFDEAGQTLTYRHDVALLEAARPLLAPPPAQRE